MAKIITFLIFILSVHVYGSFPINPSKGMPAIIDTEWLSKNFGSKDIVIVDLRSSQEYEKGHIQGAVNIPAKENLFDQNKMMPSLGFLRDVFGQAGIDSNTRVIAYDDGKFIFAARMYWILETLGHKKVALLNVGFESAKQNKIPVTNELTKVVAKLFVPRVDNSKLQTKLGTLVAIGNKTIIDGRKKSHYLGQESKAKRFGHIPTAQNYPCTQNYSAVNNANTMKDLKELQLVYKDLNKNQEIILYCDGGSESALNYIVLQELGYKASVYDGSWNEWGNDDAVPVDNPTRVK